MFNFKGIDLEVGDMVKYTVRRGRNRGHLCKHRAVVCYDEVNDRHGLRLTNHLNMIAKFYDGILSIRKIEGDELKMENTSILKSWKDDTIKELMTKAIVNGDFKNDAMVAEKIINNLNEHSFDEVFLKAVHRDIKNYNKFVAEKKINFTPETKIQRRKKQVSSLLYNHEKVETYLDYGSGNGKVTCEIVDLVKPDSAMGYDVVRQDTVNPFYYHITDTQEEVEKDSVDLITCFTVLHHADFMKSLLEMKRMLKVGGTLIIREFDASTDHDKAFNYAMDKMYFRGYLGNEDIPIKMNYFSKETWQSLFISLGFTMMGNICYTFPDDEGNPYKPFYIKLTKG